MKRPARMALAASAAALLAAAPAAWAGDPLGLMPEAASANAERVDQLTYLILWVTGFTLVGVQLTLLWFLVKFRRKEGVRAKHTHGNHTVEMVWTVVPAAILVFLAVYQMGLWAEMKSSRPDDTSRAVDVQIFAKQFEWNFRYPGPDGKYGTPDDLTTVKMLVVPVDRPVTAELRAMDVIHSFYLPAMRFKQDAVPGLHSRIWFQPDKLSSERAPIANSKGEPVKEDFFDIVCAELCGNLHTTMNAKLYVVTDEQFERWQAGEAVTISERTKVPAAIRPADLEGGPYELLWKAWGDQDDQRVTAPPPHHRNPFEGDYTGEEEEE